MEKLKKAAALSYDSKKDSAPKVVASGSGYIADKIIMIAKENGIPLFQDEYTANMLCSLPVGMEIPEELYQAVAKIYAYILKVEYESKTNKL